MQQSEEQPVEWAGFRLPPYAAEGHFFIVGAVGSGKTLTLRSLMSSVVRHFQDGCDQRAVVYDKFGETISFLRNAGLLCPLQNLNPFATDAVGWDISADWTDTSLAGDYAKLLIADRSEGSHFFVQAARELMRSVLVALMLKRQTWTLGDLVDITTNRDRLASTLATLPKSAGPSWDYFKPVETFRNVLATLDQSLSYIAEIAAVSKAIPPQRRLSFTEWSKSTASILVLGSDFQHQDQSRTLNRLMFDTIARQALARPISPQRSTAWFFLDDAGTFPAAGALANLLVMGRAHRVRVAMTCHDLEQLADIHGSDHASGIATSCANYSILKLSSTTTAEWAAQLMAGTDTYEYRRANNFEEVIDFESVNGFANPRLFVPRPPLTAEEFLRFPHSRDGRVFGCHWSRALGGAILRETTYPLLFRNRQRPPEFH